MLKKISVLTLAFLFLCPPAESGLNSPAVGVKPLGMAGAFRAVADDNSALSFNPGGITQSLRYAIEALYYWSDFTEELPERIYHVSIVDSKTSKIGAGFSFTREELSQGGGRDTYTLALAEDYRSYFHIGISGKYLRFKGTDDDSFFTSDIGIITTPWKPYLSVAVVGYNLITNARDEASPRLGLGLATRPSDAITLAADTVKDWDNNDVRYNFGGEVLLRGQFGLRGGYSGDQHSAGNFYSLGLGWYSPRITLNYGFQEGVSELDLRAHSVSFIIYF